MAETTEEDTSVEVDRVPRKERGVLSKKAERTTEKENGMALALAKRLGQRERQRADRLKKEKQKYLGRYVNAPDSGGSWHHGKVCDVIIDNNNNAWLTIKKGKYTVNVRQNRALPLPAPKETVVAEHNNKRRDKGV
jgi:hypothetical protein